MCIPFNFCKHDLLSTFIPLYMKGFSGPLPLRGDDCQEFKGNFCNFQKKYDLISCFTSQFYISKKGDWFIQRDSCKMISSILG